VTDAQPSKPVQRERTPISTRVRQASRLSPNVVRLVLSGAGLRGFPVGDFTDHYVKLLFPPDGADYGMPFDTEQVREQRPKVQWPCTRTFTVRDHDAELGELTIDFVVHGTTGIAGPWAAQAAPGDEIQLLGPGGGYAPDAAADWYLFVDLRDRQELPTAADADVRWAHRVDGARGLLDAVQALDFPNGAVDAFVHGEAGAVRAVRRHLLAERGVPREALSASGYWKRGRTDEGWRAEKPEWKRQVALDAG